MTTEDKSQMPMFSPEDEKEAQKELKRLRKNENGVFKATHKRTGFEDKTLWDWLQLVLQLIGTIAIPASIIIGVWQFTSQQQNDRMRSIDEQQQTTLQNYLGNMSDLLLKENLLSSKQVDVVRQVAEAQTLTALQNLNPARKGILVKFLYESHLIGYYDFKNNSLQRPIIVLISADLSGTDLSGTDLSGADLSDAHLSGAHLSEAYLNGANLRSAIFSGADLIGAFLSCIDLGGGQQVCTNLSGADLSGADLSDAHLSGADLSFAYLINANFSRAHLENADLSDADLSDANLSGARLNGADLSFADLSFAILTQQQLDQVSICKGAILPTGLTCHHNQ